MNRFDRAVLSHRWLLRMLQVLFGVALIAIWQGLISSGLVLSLALTPPWTVAKTVAHWLSNGSFSAQGTTTHIWIQVGSTLEVAALGFFVGVVVGITLGLLSATIPAAKYFLSPFLGFFNGIPTLILIPVFVLWLGYGDKPAIIIVALGTIFLIAAVVEGAVYEIQGVMIQHARALGANRRQMLRTVYFPGTAIWVVSVARVCVGHAIVGAVVIQFFGARSGLGFVIDASMIEEENQTVYAAIVVTSMVACCFDLLLRMVDRRISRYLPSR